MLKADLPSRHAAIAAPDYGSSASFAARQDSRKHGSTNTNERAPREALRSVDVGRDLTFCAATKTTAHSRSTWTTSVSENDCKRRGI